MKLDGIVVAWSGDLDWYKEAYAWCRDCGKSAGSLLREGKRLTLEYHPPQEPNEALDEAREPYVECLCEDCAEKRRAHEAADPATETVPQEMNKALGPVYPPVRDGEMAGPIAHELAAQGIGPYTDPLGSPSLLPEGRQGPDGRGDEAVPQP